MQHPLCPQLYPLNQLLPMALYLGSNEKTLCGGRTLKLVHLQGVTNGLLMKIFKQDVYTAVTLEITLKKPLYYGREGKKLVRKKQGD